MREGEGEKGKSKRELKRTKVLFSLPVSTSPITQRHDIRQITRANYPYYVLFTSFMLSCFSFRKHHHVFHFHLHYIPLVTILYTYLCILGKYFEQRPMKLYTVCLYNVHTIYICTCENVSRKAHTQTQT